MSFLLGACLVLVAALVGYRFGRRSAKRGQAMVETVVGPAVASQPSLRPEPAAERPDADDIERALADLRLGVVVVGIDGREVYRNNRAKEYATGRHGDALVGAALERAVDAALLGSSFEEEVEVYGPPARSLLVQASPTSEAGRLSGAVGVIDDVTKARHMLRVRSDFVANVSHELRTPVGAMSVLAETIAEADDPEIIERLSGRMLREATRLADTIDDLLALSRLESGPVEDPETIDLVSVAAMAVERTAESASHHEVEVVVDARLESVLVEGDQGQLVSVVANLVDNAVKYSNRGGRVEIRVAVASGPEASVTDERPERIVARDGERSPAPDASRHWVNETQVAELSVFDDGIGVPGRDLERIFERFYRVDGARSRESGGTGLGLSIVRNAVQNHRGTVDVVSTEGVGSTFTVRLPASSARLRPTGERNRPCRN